MLLTTWSLVKWALNWYLYNEIDNKKESEGVQEAGLWRAEETDIIIARYLGRIAAGPEHFSKGVILGQPVSISLKSLPLHNCSVPSLVNERARVLCR